MFVPRRELKARFEEENASIMGQGILLDFAGAEGYDVYNCCAPFTANGKEYIFGRVEKRNEWANSKVMIFSRTEGDRWEYVEHSGFLQLEDPFVSFIHGQIVLGGTHVRKKQSKVESYSCYFYKTDISTFTGDLKEFTYFTSGPNKMKDIRLVELADGRIGVFSRPNGRRFENGAYSAVGFNIINSLDDLNAEIIESGEYIQGLFGEGEWGGVNQAILLENGKLGIIGHMSYNDTDKDGQRQSVYCNCSFVFDINDRSCENFKIIGTKSCYAPCPPKLDRLADCAFTSGVVKRSDGRYDLYSGAGDTHEGRIVIDDPFAM